MAYQNHQPYHNSNGLHQYSPGVPISSQHIQVQIPKVPIDPAAYANYNHYNDNNRAYYNQNSYAPAQQPITYYQPTSRQASTLPAVEPHESSPYDAKASIPSTTSSSDYQLLLLSLAEDYLAAAHGGCSMAALRERRTEPRGYYKLVATGLACFAAVLKNFRLQPHAEAIIRLRYATVLHQETENYKEAEEALSKGITICDRHRLLDLKYNMQHLLARVMFSINPRASLKYVDNVVKNVEAYQHVPWIYAFRFLRVSLSLELSSHSDILAALSHLKIIQNTSKQYGDSAVSASASIMEALAHVRTSDSAESIEQAQRALAAARSSQLDPTAKSVPQFSAMSNFVDFCCSLQHSNIAHASFKMQTMQKMLDQAANDPGWTQDGMCAIPLKTNYSEYLQGGGSAKGIVRVSSGDAPCLIINWLPKEDIYALGFLLSGVAVSHRNSMDGQKAEQYLREGIRMLHGMLSQNASPTEPISPSYSRNLWRQNLLCHMQTHLILVLCGRTAWDAAQTEFSKLENNVGSLPLSPSDSLCIQIRYLNGLIHQGTGDLTTALSIYSHPSLSPSPPHSHSTHRSLSLLSSLNSLLILRSTNPRSPTLQTLLSTLSPLCLSTPNPNIRSAYYLLLATADPSPTPSITRTKSHLQTALQTAKQTSNNQLICITLNFMFDRFFKGVVGEQAEKSARASQSMAKKGRDRLWLCVASGCLAGSLEVQGKGPEAEEMRREAMLLAEGLPEGVVRREAERSG